MGVIIDPRMEDRAQIILVITGLGAPSLEETMSKISKTAKGQVADSEQVQRRSFYNESDTSWHLPSQESRVDRSTDARSTDTKEYEPLVASKNIELPAFLRRRVKVGE
jgi:hypothetical protein